MGSLNKFRAINSLKTFGVELECIPNSCPLGLDTEQYLPFFYKTHDSSLPFGGYEYISEPMPYDMMVNKIKKLHTRIGGWTTTEQCGLHIHVSRAYWPEKYAKAFSDFLYGGRWRGLGCGQNFKNWFGRVSRFAEPSQWEDGDYKKFVCINRLHSKTFEFRVWKAGDLEWTLEALRRTRAIVEYRGNWSIDKLNAICGVSEPAVPVVRRVRRAYPSLGDLLHQNINRG